MTWFEKLLRRLLPHKELGWEEIGEKFTRFVLLRTPWRNFYLHKLNAPVWHPQCHDHPWDFWTLILAGGYWEEVDGRVIWRKPGTVLYRPAEFSHNVVTVGTAWSVIMTTKKKRQWGLHDCRSHTKE